jgi:hypothetical protein
MKRKPQASSMVLTSLEDNVSDCGCTKKKKLLEASLGDLMLETTVRGAVNGAGVVGDAMRNAVRGLGDAVRACTEPFVRTASAQPVIVLTRPKPTCNTCGGNAHGKTDDENANANNNQNTISLNVIVNGYPQNSVSQNGNPQSGYAPNTPSPPPSPFDKPAQQNGAPQNGNAQNPFQTSPFTGQNQAPAQEAAPQQAPQVIREIIREPVFVEKIVEKPTIVEKIKNNLQLVKRIPAPKKVYIKRTKREYVDVVRPTIETVHDTESINRTSVEQQFDQESINRTAIAPTFDTERINRPTDTESLKMYLRQKQQRY